MSIQAPPPVAQGASRILWLAAGWTCFAIGAIGAVLPGIPTTGPMLLALACFSRSSPRFRAWLLDHPWFGPPLRRWQRDRTMPLRAKAMAIGMMTASAVYLGFFATMPSAARALALALIVVGAIVVARIPHTKSASGDG